MIVSAGPAAGRSWRPGLVFAALLAVTLAVYQPAWRGGILWDDDDHLTRAELLTADGPVRIWFELGATQQYYPVTHTAFWVMARLWGHDTLGYHLVNISLHALSAFLLAVLLRRLDVRGAVLTGFLFALHPVQAESVAWMTELKNVLSGVFYFLAALAWLRFDDRRDARSWALAFGLFVFALFSKTVTATLPAALLVVFWWRRGRLDWRRDVRPLSPFFAMAIAAGLLTVWVERTLIGARGAGFDFTPVERALIAGRAVWFYLASLAWPVHLSFVYPRWTVSQAVWWQYLYPLAALALAGLLWRLRHRSRAPLAAFLLFGGTLFPALGFFNVYPFRFSLVADHFQYLANAGMLALAAAGLASLGARWRLTGARAVAAGAIVCVPLAALTWRESHQYRDAETLYRTTIARNPGAWLAWGNLGTLKVHGTGAAFDEAVRLLEESLRLNPANAEALNSLGVAWQRLGRLDEALEAHREAIRLNPGLADAHNNLGAVLQLFGRHAEAAEAYQHAIRLNPRLATAHYNLGSVLQELGRAGEAVASLRQALALRPDYAEARDSLGAAFLRLGRPAEAEAEIRQALALRPDFLQARHNLGFVLERLGRADEAIAAYREALALDPASARTHDNLGWLLFHEGRLDESERHLRDAIRLDPVSASAHGHLANLLERTDRLTEAVTHYRTALEHQGPPDSAETHNNLGVALARLGRIREAVTHFREAVRIDPDFAEARANLLRAGGGTPPRSEDSGLSSRVMEANRP